jgi:catechol 2,3-dioxygenase-like lactoylglutathione lyase family enzyme
MDHVGIVVDDLAAATEFFVELGLELQGEGTVEGSWVDRVVGLEGVRADIAMMQTPDGNARLELTKFHSPSNQGDNRHAPANTPGIRHIAFAVEDIDTVVTGLRARGAELVGELERYKDSYRLSGHSRTLAHADVLALAPTCGVPVAYDGVAFRFAKRP